MKRFLTILLALFLLVMTMPALAENRVNLTACHASALALRFSDMIPSFFLLK